LEAEVTRVLVGLDDYVVLDAVEREDGLVVTVAVPRPEAACPRCGVFSCRVKQYVTQRVRDGMSFARLTTLVWVKRRFRCDTPGCGPSFTESTAEVPPRARLTTRLREAIGRGVRTRNVAEVAAEHRVAWWTAWRAVVIEAAKALAARPVLPPERLGLDETTFRRPQRFATGLVDLSSGRLWDLLEGRSKAVVVERFQELGADIERIGDVVIDPFAGYKAAARELVPHARRTADKFHIIRLANAAVTEVRCRRQQEITGHRGRSGDPFYAARRDLLRARENLTERGWARLGAAFAADPDLDLECAWVVKEALRDVYEAADRIDAQVALAEWYEIVEDYHVAELSRLATTVTRWETEILNWFDSHLTNGPTEGRNLIIKAVKRSGFGFRNFNNYRLRVLYRCS
jgi:transposase